MGPLRPSNSILGGFIIPYIRAYQDPNEGNYTGLFKACQPFLEAIGSPAILRALKAGPWLEL